MRQTLEYLEWKSQWWKSQKTLRSVDRALDKALVAYTDKQATLQLGLAAKFKTMWGKILTEVLSTAPAVSTMTALSMSTMMALSASTTTAATITGIVEGQPEDDKWEQGDDGNGEDDNDDDEDDDEDNEDNEFGELGEAEEGDFEDFNLYL